MTTTGPDPSPPEGERGPGGGSGTRYCRPPPGCCYCNCRGGDSHQGEDNKPFLPWASYACKHRQRSALEGGRPAEQSSRTALPAPHAAPALLTHGRPTPLHWAAWGGRRRALRVHCFVSGLAGLTGTAGRLSPGPVHQRGAPAAPPLRGAVAGRRGGEGRGGGAAGLPWR